MKEALHFTFLLVVAVGIFSCQRDVNPTVDPLKDGTLRVISIQFPGIKDADVVIDQKTHLIHAKVPPLLPQNMIPKIVLTDNAALWGGMSTLPERYENGIVFFLADSVFLPLVSKGDSLPAGGPVVTYYFIPAASGPLAMGEIKSSWEYELHSEHWDVIWVPFSNLYGNRIPASFKMKNRATHAL